MILVSWTAGDYRFFTWGDEWTVQTFALINDPNNKAVAGVSGATISLTDAAGKAFDFDGADFASIGATSLKITGTEGEWGTVRFRTWHSLPPWLFSLLRLMGWIIPALSN